MSPDPRPLDHALLDRYLAGEATAEESLAVERWLADHPGDSAAVAALHAGLTEPLGSLPDYAFDARVESVVGHSLRAARRSALHIAPHIAPHTTAPRAPRTAVHRALFRHPGSWLAVGAAAGLLIAAGLTVRGARGPAGQRATTYRTVAQQRATVTLADGSKVTLAPQTTLTVAADFGAETRTVSLRGQAYFDVTPRDRAPFVVETGTLQTRVLGTAFSVRRYDGDADVRVAVVTGRVAVGATGSMGATPPHPAVVLASGMIGRVTDSTAMVQTTHDTAAIAAWTSGSLVFHATPVPEILKALGQWYGYEFRIADSSIARRELKLEINGQSAQDMLATLKLMLDVSLTFDGQNGHIVTLRAKRAAIPADRKGRNTPWAQLQEVGR